MMASANTSYQGTNFNAMRIDLPLVPLTHPLQREAQKIPMGPRNLTGVFLGVEGTASAKCSKNSSKGQARVRGMPSSRSRTPTERKRYEKVEQLRVKEEKRGFSGQLLKKRSPRGINRSPRCSHNVSRSDIHEVIRQTHRQFTAATNSGFSRLECLQMNSGGGAYEDAAWRESIDADISQQIHRLTLHRREGQLAGLIECYRKVCKGNVDCLQPLMPRSSRKPRPLGQSGHHTDVPPDSFTVKGYRNPSSARICASFPQLQRPQTVGGGYSRQQLQQQLQLRKVARTEPRTTPALPPDTPQSNDTGIMMTSLTDALSRGRKITSSHFDSVCFEKDMFYKDQDTRSSISHPINTPCSAVDGGAGSEYRPTPRDDPASAGSAAQISKERLSMTNEASEEEASVVAPLLSEMKAAAEKSAATEDDAGGAPVGIMIGLEDEAGSAAPVEIDEADENMRAEEETPLPIEPKVPANRGRRVSITERVLKSKNSEMQLASIKFSAQCRKQQLADLLDEHAQLVTQVSEMEVDRSSSQGKENAAQH